MVRAGFQPIKICVGTKGESDFLIGQDAKLIESACLGIDIPIIHCTTLPEATTKAYEMAQSGDIVLLSPWDMFKNYAHRAQVFIDTFRAL